MIDTLLPPTSSPAPPLAAMRPGVRFMLAHPAHVIALGFGSGLSPIAPGTSGTLWAWLSFLALNAWLTSAQLGWLIGISLGVGWWACTVTARNMQIADSGHIVWDEIVAFWLVLWLVLPAGLMAQAMAFALFRLLDALKPGPMAWADRTFKGFGPWGGFGILFDDLLAAFCTLLIIALWRF